MTLCATSGPGLAQHSESAVLGRAQFGPGATTDVFHRVPCVWAFKKNFVKRLFLFKVILPEPKPMC